MGDLQIRYCAHCEKPIRPGGKFCSACGKPVFVKRPVERFSDYGMLLRVSSYMFLTIGILAIHRFHVIANEVFNQYMIMDILLMVLTLVFAIINDNGWINAYRKPKWRPLLLFLLLAGSVGFAFLVNFSVDHLNRWLGASRTNLIDLYADTANPLLMAVIFWALVPAVFEEMAFRGFLFYDLMGSFNGRTTIVITSLLFTISHFNLFSSFWIFPFALFLGYLRLRYRSLWYCMLVHFCHNLLAVILEYQEWAL